MGACDFANRVEKGGRTAKEAFADVTADARHYHGHGGYTGTIAEKSGFRMIYPNAGETPSECHDRLLNAWSGPFSDKWGDAGCLDDGEDWIFFGSASC